MAKFGSARSDERGLLKGGVAGDQTGREVMIQDFYVHKKGWYILRAKDANLANSLAFCMAIACQNENIGYDQNERLGVIKNGICTTTPTEADCSSLVRACLKQCGHNVDNFTTANETYVLMATGLFDKITYKAGVSIMTGDILVTQTVGHTGIITEGIARNTRPTYDIPQPVLKKGSKGAEVGKLQRWLNDFCGQRLSVDQSFGPATEKGLKNIQAFCGLKADGIYGPKSEALARKSVTDAGYTAV